MIHDPREQPLTTVPAAGAWLGLGRSAAYDAVRRGEIPVIRIGRRMFVPVAELHEMVGLGERSGRNSNSYQPHPLRAVS